MKFIRNLSPEETAKLISETDAKKVGCIGDITKWKYTVRKKKDSDEWLVGLTLEQYEATIGLEGEELEAITMLTREQLDSAVDSIDYDEWEVVEL